MHGLVEQPGLVKNKMSYSAAISRKRLLCGVISALTSFPRTCSHSSRSIISEQTVMEVSVIVLILFSFGTETSTK